MDECLLYGCVATLLMILLGLLLLLKNIGGSSDTDIQTGVHVDGLGRREQVNRIAANRNARAQMRAAQTRVHASDDERENDDDGDDSDDIRPLEEDITLPGGKIGKKKLAKLQAKADKRAMREAEERERQEYKERAEKTAEEQRKKEGKEAEEEAKRLEEERKMQEEKERKEQEEYNKMKQLFSVEEEGCVENSEKEAENLLQEFVHYVKKQKVVILEELASMFQLKTQQVIERINVLISEGTLTGVLDDRGKFIYISERELLAVAEFVNQRGRVSVADLAEASNGLINLASPVEATV